MKRPSKSKSVFCSRNSLILLRFQIESFWPEFACFQRSSTFWKKRLPTSSPFQRLQGLNSGWASFAQIVSLYWQECLMLCMKTEYLDLELQTTSFLWLVQLDDSKSLHKKRLFYQTSIKKWLFRVPGKCVWIGIGLPSRLTHSDAKLLQERWLFWWLWARFPRGRVCPRWQMGREWPNTCYQRRANGEMMGKDLRKEVCFYVKIRGYMWQNLAISTTHLQQKGWILAFTLIRSHFQSGPRNWRDWWHAVTSKVWPKNGLIATRMGDGWQPHLEEVWGFNDYMLTHEASFFQESKETTVTWSRSMHIRVLHAETAISNGRNCTTPCWLFILSEMH